MDDWRIPGVQQERKGGTVRIVKAQQVTSACPVQWDAWTDDGKQLYLRYRSARGQVRIIDPDDPNESFYRPPEISFHRDDVHPCDGEIELEEFCKLAGLELELTQEEA